MSLVLRPAMTGEDVTAPSPRAVWVGGVVAEELTAGEDVRLEGGTGHARARLLVWQDDVVRGFAEVPVAGGTVDGALLARRIAALPAPATPPPAAAPVATSVIVATRDRPADLRRCLRALLDLEHPDLEVVVVDSASRDPEAARAVVAACADPRVRLHRVERPGLARARNAGVAVARHDRLAFTDDDVVVDRRWLRRMDDGFARDPAIACVTGMVASGELASDAQHYFDRRVTWASSLRPVVFSLADPPADPLFPFHFGAYGTGANFAMRRAALEELGGFDPALGAGTATGAGEDTDVFVRLILHGHALLYEPDAVVWHRHRVDRAALARQLENYGLGIGAVLAKLLADPRARRLMLPLVARGVRHALTMVRVDEGPAAGPAPPAGTAPKELAGLLRGPLALRRARRHEARLVGADA